MAKQTPTTNNTGNGQIQSTDAVAAAVNALPDEAKAGVVASAIQDMADPETAGVLSTALKDLGDEETAEVVTSGLRSLTDNATADVVASAMQTLPDDHKAEVLDRFAPDQAMTNDIWRWIVRTFAIVLVAATLALTTAVLISFWQPVDAAMMQMLLTIFTTTAGILAGFVSGRASSARGRF